MTDEDKDGHADSTGSPAVGMIGRDNAPDVWKLTRDRGGRWETYLFDLVATDNTLIVMWSCRLRPAPAAKPGQAVSELVARRSDDKTVTTLTYAPPLTRDLFRFREML